MDTRRGIVENLDNKGVKLSRSSWVKENSCRTFVTLIVSETKKVALGGIVWQRQNSFERFVELNLDIKSLVRV